MEYSRYFLLNFVTVLAYFNFSLLPSEYSFGQETAAIGSIGGRHYITNSGAAGYKIPLAVPPGRAGIQPALSLNYNSLSGDGLLGVGWDISGFSEITRCPSRYSLDKKLRPVTFDKHDNLCLDGEPLIIVKGAKFQHGAEYRTVPETFKKIIGIGSSHHAFIVYQKDGQIDYYGADKDCQSQTAYSSEDASYECSGVVNAKDNIPRSWLHYKRRDRFGNQLTISYKRKISSFSDDYNGDGQSDVAGAPEHTEYYPNEIRYTSHPSTGLPAERLVKFFYKERKDKFHGYYSGINITRSVLLSNVLMTVSGYASVYRYYLSYESSPSTKRSRLISVKQCTTPDICNPATTFEWQDSEVKFGTAVQSKVSAPPITTAVDNRRIKMRGLITLDMNDDGRTDLLYTRNGTWRFVKAESYSPYYLTEEDTGIEAKKEVSGIPFDYNDDNKMDILIIDGVSSGGGIKSWKVLQSTGNNFTLINTGINANHSMNVWADTLRSTHLVDLDGDGDQDLLHCEPDPTFNGVWTYRQSKSGTFSTKQVLPLPPGSDGCFGQKVMFLDINGDGALELLSYNIHSGVPGMSYQATLIKSTNEVHFLDTGISPNVEYFDNARSLDLNGDGLQDIVWSDLGYAKTAKAIINTGRGFIQEFKAIANDAGGFMDAIKLSIPFDWNGDGKDDLLMSGDKVCPMGMNLCYQYDLNWSVLEATGLKSSFDEAGEPLKRTALGIPYTKAGTQFAEYQRPRIVDVDGDLRPDLLLVVDDKFVVHRGPKATPDLIIRVRDGGLGLKEAKPEANAPWSVQFAYSSPHNKEVYKQNIPGLSPSCPQDLSCRKLVAPLVATLWEDRGESVPAAEFTYKWYNAIFDFRGEGFLGFGYRTIEDQNYDTTTASYFDNQTRILLSPGTWAFPFRGLKTFEAVRTKLNDDLNYHVYQKWEYDFQYEFNNQNYFTVTPIERREVHEGSDAATMGASATELTSTLTLREYDSYGNTTLISTTIGDETYQIERTFSNNFENWLIGKITSEEVTSIADSTGKVRKTTFLHNGIGGALSAQKRESIGPDTELTIEYYRDKYGNIIERRQIAADGSKRSDFTEFTDDEYMFPSKEINALGVQITRTHSKSLGQLLTSSDYKGTTSSWDYDGFGRLIYQGRDGAGKVNINYLVIDDSSGASRLMIEYQSSAAPLRRVFFDRLGRVVKEEIETEPGIFAKRLTTYNLKGEIAATSLPFISASTSGVGYFQFEYDNLGRTTQVSRPDNMTTKISYNKLETRRKDALGNITKVRRNKSGRVVQVTDALSGILAYDYGHFGQLTKVIDSYGNKVLTTYDNYGRRESFFDPNSGLSTFKYDNFDRLQLETDASGNQIKYTYDLLDRITQKTDADGVSKWQYDSASFGIGQLHKQTSPWGHYDETTYDSFGRISSVTYGVAPYKFKEQYKYNGSGLLTELEVQVANPAATFRVGYEYDSSKNFKRVRDLVTNQIVWEQSKLDVFGRVLKERFGNGVLTERVYNPLTLNIEQIITRKSANVIQNLQFTYNEVGNLDKRQDRVRHVVQGFEYDDLYRLKTVANCTSAEHSLGLICLPSIEYGYDKIGNIIYRSDVGGYEYQSEKPHAVTRIGDWQFSYDELGNQVTRPDGLVAYTSFNKPSKLMLNDGLNVTFEYDAIQQRVLKSSDEGKVYRGGNFLEREITIDGIVDRFKIITPNGVVAVQEKLAGSVSQIFYHHHDHLDSAVTITDSSGNAVSDAYFGPFGTNHSGSWIGESVPLADGHLIDGYTGHSHDTELGLVDMGGRIYDATLGRFLSADPLISAPYSTQAFNRYSYVYNNPLNITDPTGYSASSSYHDFETAYIHSTANQPTNDSRSDYDDTRFRYPRMVGMIEPDNGSAPLPIVVKDSAIQSAKTGCSLLPVCGSLLDFDENLDSAGQALADAEYLKGGIYLGLAIVDGGSAILEGLTLGGGSVATVPFKAAAKKGAKESLDKAGKKLARSCDSFARDTKVVTPDGFVAISELKEGQLVIGFDEELGKIGEFAVTATTREDHPITLKLWINNELIHTTPEHPFHTKQAGWIKAGWLKAGMEIRRVDGSFGQVSRIEYIRMSSAMYDITVDKVHNFFVGDLGLLTHNTDCQVYLAAAKDGTIQYVGISKDIIRRFKSHQKNKGSTFEIQEIAGLERLSRDDARAVEQALIEILGLGRDGGSLNYNLINSVSPQHSDYRRMVDTGYELLAKAGYLTK